MIFLREGIGSDASDHNIWSDDFQLVSIFFSWSDDLNSCSFNTLKLSPPKNTLKLEILVFNNHNTL